MREVDEAFVEGGIFAEMSKIACKARRRYLVFQLREFFLIYGEAGGLAARKSGIRHDVAPFVVSIYRVLRRQARQDAEGVNRHVGMALMKFLKIAQKLFNLGGGGLFSRAVSRPP